MVLEWLNRDKSFSQGTRELLSGVAPTRSAVWRDSKKWNVAFLHGRGDNHKPAGDGPAPFASFNGNGDRLFDRTRTVNTVRQGSICFQYQNQRFFQISLNFRERFSLGIDSRDFFDISQVPLPALHIDCSELSDHSTSKYTR